VHLGPRSQQKLLSPQRLSRTVTQWYPMSGLVVLDHENRAAATHRVALPHNAFTNALCTWHIARGTIHKSSKSGSLQQKKAISPIHTYMHHASIRSHQNLAKQNRPLHTVISIIALNCRKVHHFSSSSQKHLNSDSILLTYRAAEKTLAACCQLSATTAGSSAIVSRRSLTRTQYPNSKVASLHSQVFKHCASAHTTKDKETI
jgi:hypothetical protein